MKKTMTSELALASASDLKSAVEAAWAGVGQSLEQFCLLAGATSIAEMLVVRDVQLR